MEVFNAFYYSWSPAIAELERRSPALRSLIGVLLYPLIGCLMASTPIFHLLSLIPEFAVLATGITASLLIGFTYSFPPLLAMVFIERNRKLSLPLKLSISAVMVSIACFLVAEAVGIRLLLQFSSVLVVIASLLLGLCLAYKSSIKLSGLLNSIIHKI